MATCDDAERLIAREVDGALDRVERARLDVHLGSCAGCRAALATQREVAALLRARVPAASADLASRVAARLHTESGVLGLANWRAWTLGLAPVAAALLFAAYLGIGASANATTRQSQAVTAVDEWNPSSSTSTSVLMQPGATGDALVEAVLTGTATAGETHDVR